MNLRYIVIFVFICLFCADTRAQTNCEVTYTGNEGFLVKSGGHKIMIDALFGGIQGDWCEEPGDSVLNMMMKGAEPFGNIDYILVTHNHIDHFKDSIVMRFLISNQNTTLICPSQVNDVLARNGNYGKVSERISVLTSPDTVLIGDGVSIRSIRMKHGAYYETDSATGKQQDRHRNTDNYVYLVNLGGHRIFHTGDCSTAEIQRFKECIPGDGAIDIGFFNRTFFGKEGIEILNFLGPKNIIMMHIENYRIEYYKSAYKNFPAVNVFESKLRKKIYD